jgi:tetratricopeptide (TPR) repeat protein
VISIEGQVRLLLRAWPKSDRVERGDEILTTTLDLSPPGRGRLRLALVASLVVGGLRARWRLRPPLWAWWNYAFHQTMRPSRSHRWMLDDLLTPGWCRRMMARNFAAWAVVLGIATVVLGLGDSAPSLGNLLAAVIFSAGAGSFLGAVLAPSAWARERRTQILAQHGYDNRGQPDPLLPRKFGLARARRRRGADDVPTLRWATDLGSDMASVGQLEDAVCLLGDTFERAKRVAPEHDSPTWQAGYLLACALAEQGRVDEAIPIGREVLAGWRAVHGPNHERSLGAAGMLGELLRRVGQVEEGTSLLSDAFERGKKVMPADDWPTWWTGARLAATLAQQGRIDDAVEISREVVAARRRVHGPDHAMTLEAAADLGELLRTAGRLEDGIAVLLDTFERAKSRAAAEAMQRSGKHLAGAYLDRHQLDEARDVAAAVLSEPSHTQLLSSDDVEFLRALLPRAGGSRPER